VNELNPEEAEAVDDFPRRSDRSVALGLTAHKGRSNKGKTRA
jgi:hypothetical protein